MSVLVIQLSEFSSFIVAIRVVVANGFSTVNEHALYRMNDSYLMRRRYLSINTIIDRRESIEEIIVGSFF